MTTTRKIAHNTIIQIVGKVFSTALGLLALGMMTRYLGTEQFGWYITTISFLGFIGILIDFGLIPVTAQMMSEPQHDKKALFKNLISFRFFTALLFLAIAPAIALLFPYPTQVKQAIALTAIAFLGVAMNQVFLGFYQTKLKMHIQVIGENVGRIVLVIGLWLLMARNASFLPLMTVVVLNSLAYTAVLWVWAKKETSVSFGFDWNIWKSIMTKMWPIAISIIFNVVYLKGDIIILSLFKTQTEVGIYGAAYRVIDILAQTAMMLMGVMLPLLAFAWSRKLKDGFKRYYQQAFDAMMMLALPMMVGTIVLADKIMHIVGGEEFIISGKPLQILAIAVFGVYLGAVFGHAAVAINKQKQTIWIYVSNAVITLVGYLIFIPMYGMYGAAWMTVFSELYAGLLLWATIKHYSQEKLQLKTFVKIIFASATMGGVLLLVSDLNIFVLIVLGIAVYGTMIILTKGISRETIREIIAIKKA
ncbi:MAG: flippase [Candidatus Magasanikbacteria bacterium]|jgi:O-antigen/teichoic acid export membrane protein|nr:flippase [Candidatus Magasanikbacteria bacterium]MBT4314873.1 flippase [Candidatus Magasanikbacteria bacterium]MBT4546740.1 flippase [Candidatus Magasanikbacteria bacterium]MBT6819651.1 flippase [Candidatus Magasanikbacteria bacterium]